MTRISPLRRGAKRGVVVGAEDRSMTASDPTGTSFPISASAVIPTSPSYESAPTSEVKHCTKELNSLRLWVGGVFEVEPYQLEYAKKENGDFQLWMVAVIGPKTKSKRTSKRP